MSQTRRSRVWLLKISLYYKFPPKIRPDHSATDSTPRPRGDQVPPHRLPARPSTLSAPRAQTGAEIACSVIMLRRLAPYGLHT